MRKLLIKSIFLLNFFCGFSQPYQSIFGNTETKWSLVKEGMCDYICSSFYSPDGDTVLGLNTYSILPEYGFIREDSTIGKVWFYDTILNQEFLVMDLELNVSDVFMIYDFSGNSQEFIVDSVSNSSGKKKIFLNAWINMCGMMETLTFIEGSGPNSGFNYQGKWGGNDITSY